MINALRTQRKMRVIILPWETHRDCDLLVRMRSFSRELSVTDGACGGRVPNMFIYSFMHLFAHSRFVN